ncbi:related to ribonucleases [Phialocephala subalpina]|uniref:Ribonuclease T2-like n=1 Tax=Phialocephala subalpina TaxID=576137 RepID=A0A1L7WW34_9HELO|nr:related to ribonucleases [Phialocephala subalpina]
MASFSKIVLASIAALQVVLAGSPKTCSNPTLSCHNTTSIADTCCFNAPGGQLVQTQFWDTSPSTGPSNSWTIHGLWPDHCDGTYDSNCDASRAYTNITSILQSYGKTDLLSDMNTYWVDINGDDESFWEHEWSKHGTCISTFKPSCYTGYTAQEEVPDFFQKTVDLFKTLDSYTALANAGITPSSTETYTSAAILAALKASFGQNPTIQCSSGALDEIWYSFDVLGSVQTGTFQPAAPVGQSSSCSSTGIKYLPKSGGTVTTTTSATKTTTATSTPTGTGSFSGSGYLNAYTGGSQDGCLISAGTWYTTGTCATYTATASGSGFTLKSSKGSCGISSDTFTCASGVTATVFTASNGLLAYNGATTFYATAVPSGSTQATVYTSSQSVSVEFQWQSV